MIFHITCLAVCSIHRDNSGQTPGALRAVTRQLYICFLTPHPGKEPLARLCGPKVRATQGPPRGTALRGCSSPGTTASGDGKDPAEGTQQRGRGAARGRGRSLSPHPVPIQSVPQPRAPGAAAPRLGWRRSPAGLRSCFPPTA